MIVCDSARALNMISIPLAILLGRLTPGQIFVTAFVGGTMYVFFTAAESGCLPNVVDETQLGSAVAAQETTSSATRVVAPPIGGALIQARQGLPFLTDAMSYVASVVALKFVRVQRDVGADGSVVALRSLLQRADPGACAHPFSTTMPIFGIASLSNRLSATPDELRSRVGTSFRLIAWSTAPIGAAIAGVLLGKLGPAATSLVFASWVFTFAAQATSRRDLHRP